MFCKVCAYKTSVITLTALFLSHQEVIVLSFYIAPLAEGDSARNDVTGYVKNHMRVSTEVLGSSKLPGMF